MPTPTYTIQQDPVWKATRASTAPTVSSTYSDDYHNAIPGSHALDVPDLMTAKDSYHPAYHAHPRQQINDHGPQVRQSRLPIFKQVRSMLHKPPPITTPGNPKWDDYTGELSASGKPSSVQPSNYTSPYDGAFKASRKRSPERSAKGKRNMSPVSVLRDEEVKPVQPIEQDPKLNDDTEWSPVSPVSPVSRMTKETWERDDISEMVPDMMPEPLSPNVQRAPQAEVSPPPSIRQSIIKRKPVSRCVSSAENYPPVPSPQNSPSQSSDTSDRMMDDKDLPPIPPEHESESHSHQNSHFSWSTYAHSVAPGRQSIDTVATRKNLANLTAPQDSRSRFSWSTVATNMHPNQAQGEPSSPPPPVPSKFPGLPVQSILSRRRPVQRMEEKEWAPPPRESSLIGSRSATPKNSSTPTSAQTSRPLPLPKDTFLTPAKSRSPAPNTPNSNTSRKALPPPPTLAAENLSHLEALLAQERSIILQRRNVEKGIHELEKIENASPLEVSFDAVRSAKRRLVEYRTRLAEVKLEERDLGIAIARARRRDEKENGGDGESLWVRRVTG